MSAIYLGLPRTGSTYLQNFVFPELEKQGIKVKESESSLFYTYMIDLDYMFWQCKMLKLRYPDCKVVLGLRDKESWKKSYYSEYIRHGGTYNFSEWCNHFNMDNVNMDKVKNLIFNAFGKDNVFVYHQKDLDDNLIKDMISFLGGKPFNVNGYRINAGYKGKYLRFARWLNRRNWLLNPNFYLQKLNPKFSNRVKKEK